MIYINLNAFFLRLTNGLSLKKNNYVPEFDDPNHHEPTEQFEWMECGQQMPKTTHDSYCKLIDCKLIF